MRVQVHPADDGGCGWYRLRWPQKALDAQGADVVLGDKLNIGRQPENEFLPDRPIAMLTDVDVLVFQRPMKHELLEMIGLAQRQGIAVVVEIDDDFQALPPNHPARASTSPARYPHRNREWLRRACMAADLVTCTTPALAARYAPHGRAAILPNLVPESYLTVDVERARGVTIGWTGTPVTHVGDLDVLGTAVHDVCAYGDARFCAIGSARTLPLLDVAGECIDWAPLLTEYPRVVARLDVGLVPLLPNAFNAAKSALKACEYAALGVVPVVSPTPDNLRMANHGVGLVASDEQDWRRVLRLLVDREDLRVELAAQGRETMREHTYERQSWRWLEAWDRALSNRRGVPLHA